MQQKARIIQLPPFQKTEDSYAIPSKKEAIVFEFFFKKYFSYLCYFANSIVKNEDEARDIVHDTFLKLWEKQTIVDKSETVRSFLYTVVYNECINLLRKRKVKVRAVRELQYLDASYDPQFLENVTWTEVLRNLFEALETLPSETQQIFQLYYFEKKKYEEIGVLLNKSAEAVRKQKERAIALLRNKLKPSIFIIVSALLLK